MSRSNPTDTTVNPATRWHEWNGENGTVRYYDKEKKENVEVGSDFDFILLDELATVRGWNEESASGIYSNEVRDTRQDTLVVKAFKGGTIAAGLYQAIKTDVKAAGGHFFMNLYIAFKPVGGKLAIGSIRFKGSALGAWLEFRKAHRAELYGQAVKIHGFTEDKKGRVVFRVPTFELKKLSPASDNAALDLDKELQAYLNVYLTRTTVGQVDTPTTHAAEPPAEPPADAYDAADVPDLNDDDIPF